MIDLLELYNGITDKIDINETIEFNKEDISNTEILEEFASNIIGYIDSIGDEVNINCKIMADILLPCSITLEPVKYRINAEYNDYIDINLINSQKTLDLKEFLWQNIVVEIPSKVVSENVHKKTLKGEGWALLDKEKPKNNPFSDLANIIDKKG